MAERTTYPWLEAISDRTLKDAFRWVIQKLLTVERVAKSESQGTLNPDQRPKNLGPGDAGTRFFSIDYARPFLWTGSGWQDAPDTPTRYAVGFFPGAPEPPIGWAICDGRSILRSTSSAGVVLYTTPITSDYGGLKAWIRL